MHPSSEDVKTLGSILKRRRQDLNLSLKEVENSTSIRMSYLQALEEGENHKLISPIYAHGFMKQYSQFLGLDGEQLIRENPQIFNRDANHEFAYGIGTVEMRGNPGASIKWVPNAIWVGAFGLLFIAAWFIAKSMDLL